MVKNHKIIILRIIFIIIIIGLIISNIYFINKSYKHNKETIITEEYIFNKIDDKFDKTKKYYKVINYTQFKKYFKGDKIRTIAIIDNTSNTSNKFLETINKIVFYKNTNIYLLELNKLSKKNLISYYELDENFKNLESNYLITIKDNKILSLVTFTNEDLNILEEGIGE